jgi:hypothetical protein
VAAEMDTLAALARRHGDTVTGTRTEPAAGEA